MRHKAIFTLLIIFSLSHLDSVAQECVIEITHPAQDTTICLGDSVYLRSEGSCDIYLNEGFESGIGSGWTSAYANPVFPSNGCGDEYFPLGAGPNGFYCWVGPNGTGAFPRSITSDTFDITLGNCWMKFWMRYGRAEHSGNSDCEDPDEIIDGLHLQYSTDFGATWIDLPGVNQYPIGPNTSNPAFLTYKHGSGGYWQPTPDNPVGGMHIPERYDTSSVYWWHKYTSYLPPAAVTAGTMIRFYQQFPQSAKSDTWGIDEVLLYCSNNQNVFWSHGPTVFNPVDPVAPTVTTDYIVTVFDSLGNFATDTVTITVVSTPNIDLGPDTVICDDGINTAYFDAGSGYEHYLWNTGDTTQVITPNITGWYSVIVSNYKCYDEDSVYLQMIPAVIVDAGSDEIICDNDWHDLSASAIPPTASDYSSILWYGGAGTFDDPTAIAPIYTPAPGEYGPITLNMIGYGLSPCENDSSQMILTVILTPDIDLGPDTVICDNGINTAYFDAGSGYENYLWNTGDTTQVITPNITGWYSVIVSNYNCYDEDSVHLQMTPAVIVDAGSDEIICENESHDLSASTIPPTASDYSSILWYGGTGIYDDPTAIAPTYTPGPGEFGPITLNMIGYGLSPCENDSSQMTLTVVQSASAFAGSDEMICIGQSFDFATSTLVPFAANYDTLYWTGGAGSFIDPNVEVPVYVPAAGELGPVTLTLVTSGMISNCDSVDQMVLTIHPDYLTTIDTTICYYDSVFAQGSWQLVSGTYYDTLQSIYGCDSIIQTNLTVRPEIDYDFSTNPNAICDGEVIDFIQSGSANITSFLWDFGDGQTSTSLNPSHQYINPGNYTITLSYTDNNGCSDSKNHSITVYPFPDVDFYYSIISSCMNGQVDFTGFSNSNIVQWNWNFGDGQTGTGQNTSHFYQTHGLFIVTLTVISDQGCTNMASHTIYISPPPVADFAYYVVQCDTTQFTDLSTPAPGFNLVQWEWAFGDGDSSDLQNPWHVYDSSGMYMVTLIVTADSMGLLCNDTIIKPIKVLGHPTSYFTWDPEPTCLGTTTSFFGTSGGNIAGWYWDLGDGNFTTGQDPEHTYLSTDTFNVMLTVTDINGCTDSVNHNVRVIEAPDVDFIISPNPTCQDNQTIFNGLSTDNIINWRWDFGNGANGLGQNTMHAYSEMGAYTVELTVADSAGCTSSISYPLAVNAPPQAFYTHTPGACSNDSVYFTNYSTTPNGYIQEWEWDFGDGTIATIQNPLDPDIAHQFSIGGTYTVNLTVLDSDSCQHTYSQIIEIESSPIADFNNPPACDGEYIDFTDLSSPNGGSTIVYWYWEFDDPSSGSNTSIQQNPAHIFSSPGTYNVLLVVHNIAACPDTIVKTIQVNELPEVDFTMSSTTACVNDEISFTSIAATAINHLWHFGDGGTSVLSDPQHYYQDPGTYTVSLTVTDDNGCSSSVNYDIVIEPVPFSAFTNTAPACTSTPVLFMDQSGTVLSYLTQWHWYFGDGTDTVVSFPDDPNVSHYYANAGSYITSLSITNSSGCIDSVSQQLIVSQGPEAMFDYPGGNCEGSIVPFQDQSQGFGSTIGAWQWNFGDPASGANNTSNLQDPIHQFDTAGTYTVTLEVTLNDGCYDVVSQQVTIAPAPAVYFTMNPETGCYSELTYFYTDPDSTNLAEVTSYFWDFDDPASGINGTSTLQDPTHIFTSAGTYEVALVITDINDCQNTIIREVQVYDKPFADYYYDAPCIADSIQFYDESITGGAQVGSWFWDFDDPNMAPNNTSSLQHPKHLFSSTGTYNVMLIVTDLNGCMDTSYKTIIVGNSPTSAFRFNQACDPPRTIFFNDSSWVGIGGEPIVEWFWELEPGYYSYEVNPQYSYDYADSCYQVNLTVTNQNGCSHTSSRTVCVKDALTIAMTGDDVCQGERTFFNSTYHPGTDSILQWSWNFGDGTPLIHTSQDTISHKYTEAGNYHVTVTAVNTDQCESETFREIMVKAKPEPNFAATIAKCDEATKFTDLSAATGSIITSWEWDFGDGNYSSLQNPEHIYGPMDSIYLVTLTLSNADACVNYIQKEVIKSVCVQASFELDNGLHCNEQNVCFTDASYVYANQYPLTRWEWIFGDGTTKVHNTYQENVCHEYSNMGTYEVTLIVSALVNGVLHHDTTMRDVHLLSSPISDFAYSKPCINNSTQFTDLTQGHGSVITSWRWDFGDYTVNYDTSSLQHPTFNYTNPGIYTIALVTMNNYGCSDTLYQEIEIFKRPDADFSYTLSCAGKKTNFLDQTIAGQAPFDQWNWNFGEGQGSLNTSSIQNPGFIYEQEGNYTVQLKVSDYNTCEDIISKVIEVNPTPESDFYIVSNYEGIYGQILCENLSEGAQYYAWDFGNGKTSERESPKVLFEENGIYLIQLVTTNEYQCADTMYQEYEVIRQGLYVPNAFAPSGGIAELKTFKPVGVNLNSYKIEIVNRWNAVVWSSMKLDGNGSPAESWDGTYKGSPAPAGDYLWMIKAQFKTGVIWQGSDAGDGNTKTYGTITLIR